MTSKEREPNYNLGDERMLDKILGKTVFHERLQSQDHFEFS